MVLRNPPNNRLVFVLSKIVSNASRLPPTSLHILWSSIPVARRPLESRRRLSSFALPSLILQTLSPLRRPTEATAAAGRPTCLPACVYSAVMLVEVKLSKWFNIKFRISMTDLMLQLMKITHNFYVVMFKATATLYHMPRHLTCLLPTERLWHFITHTTKYWVLQGDQYFACKGKWHNIIHDLPITYLKIMVFH